MRRLPSEVHFSNDIFVTIADFSSAVEPGFLDLLRRYPVADGVRDISIAEAFSPTRAEEMVEALRRKEIPYACIGWLMFTPYFVLAAEKKGLTPRQYADQLYDLAEGVNGQIGFRGAWIEAYGEIGNSMVWPEGTVFTKAQALEYFRKWFPSGSIASEHWGNRLIPPETPSYYTHARSRNADLRTLPIYYCDGTLFALHEGFRLGFPLVVYEGQCDTTNPSQTGIAFVRGGARMHDAWWGVDFSPWAGWPLGDGPRAGVAGGWATGMSADHMFRSWLTAYLSGCNTFLHEVSFRLFYVEGEAGEKTLSDFGYQAMRFQTVVHGVLGDRGDPVNPFAILLEEAHGYRGDQRRTMDKDGKLLSAGVPIMDFNIKGGTPAEWLLIWNGSTKVTRDDWGVHELIRAIWPVAPGLWQKTGAARRPDQRRRLPDPSEFAHLPEALVAGDCDPRECHRYLSVNRWSDCFDVVQESSPVERLQEHYKVLFLAGGIRTDARNWETLTRFMEGGGEVVAAADHLTPVVAQQLGLALLEKPQIRQVARARLEGREIEVGEELALCATVAGGSRIVAEARNVPLIVHRSFGKGGICVLLFSHGLTADGTAVSGLYAALIDSLHGKYVGVRVQGGPCQLLVNRRSKDILVTIMNPSSRDWQGEIVVRKGALPSNAPKVGAYDVITGATIGCVAGKADEETLCVKCRVPAWEARVVAVGEPADPGKYAAKAHFTSDPSQQQALERIRRDGPLARLR